MAGSARDKPLTKEEQEEEEMRNELTNAGLYEDNMGLQEMRDLVKAVNDSKNVSYMSIESSPIRSPSISNLQSTPELSKAILERPLPSYSYRNAVQASDMEVAGPSRNKEKSPESIYDSKFDINTSQTDSPSDNDKNLNLKSDDFPELLSRTGSSNNSPSEGPKLRSYDRKKPAILKKSNVENWKLNPYKIVDNGDYKPPKDFEKANFKINMEYLNEEFIESQKFQEMYEQVTKDMDKLHEKFVQEAVSRNIENLKTQPQWGSPIKVATKSGWNGSLDKNPSKEKQEPTERVSTRSTHERATKRKALNTIAAVAFNDSSVENNNADDSGDEFVETKKRKCQQAKKGDEAAKKNKEVAKNKASVDVNNDLEMIDVDKNNTLKDRQPSDLEVFDNSSLHSLRKSTLHNDSSQNLKVVDDRPQYPIRITPPNPAKKSNKGPRARNNKKINQENNNAIKKKMGISDEEIKNVLNTLDEEIDDNDNDCIDITDVIKPSPVRKPVQRKLQLAQTHLKNVINEEEQRNKTEEKLNKKKDEEEAQKRNERVKKRLEAIEEEKRLNEEKEKKSLEQQELYKNLFNHKSGRVTRANFKRIKPNNEETDEDALLEDDDDEPMITHANIVTKSRCPICQKSFPSDKIEEHASECDAFSLNDDLNINKPSTSFDDYTCRICNKFRTHNAHSYEDHVTECKQEAEDKRTGIYA